MSEHYINCEQCEENLFEFHEGRLNPEQSGQIDQHLESCDDCAALLNDIWQMNLVRTRWQDESVPDLENMQRMQETQSATRSRATVWQQWFATAASVFAVVIVLSDIHFQTTPDGISLKVGRPEYLSETALEEFRQQQDNVFDDRFARLTAQQVASNQLMLRAVLENSRDERREDFSTLVTYWNTAQAQQFRETREDLQYLILAQAEDDKDIEQLNTAFQEIRQRRGKDM